MHLVLDGPAVRACLDARLDEAARVRKLMWDEAKADSKQKQVEVADRARRAAEEAERALARFRAQQARVPCRNPMRQPLHTLMWNPPHALAQEGAAGRMPAVSTTPRGCRKVLCMACGACCARHAAEVRPTCAIAQSSVPSSATARRTHCPSSLDAFQYDRCCFVCVPHSTYLLAAHLRASRLRGRRAGPEARRTHRAEAAKARGASLTLTCPDPHGI